MKIIFLSIILHYSKHFKLNPKNSINEIKWLNIAKITKNITDFNKEYNTLYMHRRKNWECCVYFFLHNFTVCQRFAVCNIAGTRQTWALCRVLKVCRVHPFSAHGKHTCLPCVVPLACVFWADTRQIKILPWVEPLSCAVSSGTRQMSGLPCARVLTHSKGSGTRQFASFR